MYANIYVYVYMCVSCLRKIRLFRQYQWQGGRVPGRAGPCRNDNSCQDYRASCAKYMRRAMPAMPCQPCRASRAVPSVETPRIRASVLRVSRAGMGHISCPWGLR